MSSVRVLARRRGRAVAAVVAATLGLMGVQALPQASPVHAATASSMDGIVPQPVTVQKDTKVAYNIEDGTKIYTDAGSSEAGRVGEALAEVLRPSTGYALPVSSTSTEPADGISLLLSGAPSSVGDEGYQLDVTATRVVIRAKKPAGLFAGVQTLRQILPAEIGATSKQPGPWSVPGGHIEDYPRFGHRGAMLDVARHFFTVDQVKRYIDQLAQYKINYLKLHLTDDQGWRIAIKDWPKLTEIGGATGLGGGPGGFYTKEDYEALVKYAASRYITIVPEIDMPGHVGAALASYPELNCDGKSKEINTTAKVGESSLCMTEVETAKKFVAAVIKEVAGMTPGKYISIGGDEAHNTKDSDFADFMAWAQKEVVANEKTPMGWNQIVKSPLHSSTVAVYWDGDQDALVKAASSETKTKVIMAPVKHAYLDMKYGKDTAIGHEWAALIDVTAAYEWKPEEVVTGLPASGVAGIEAPLWSESVTTPQDIDYLTFPRLPAYAEIGWSPQSTHNLDGFKKRLAAQGPRWDVQGTRYYHSSEIPWPKGPTGPTGAITSQQDDTCVDVARGSSANGTQVQIYTCNDTPAQQWTLASDGTVRALGKCLTPSGTKAGTPVQLHDCAGTPAQQWTQYNGSLRNSQSQRCLNVSTGTSANGSALQLADCNNTRPQWFTPPAGVAGDGPAGPVVATGIRGSKCMDVPRGESKDGTPVTLHDCNQSSAQRWLIRDDGTLRSLGKCLDTEGGGTVNGTKIQLNSCNNTPTQKWKWNWYQPKDSGLGIYHVASGRCLDIPDASTTNGTQLQLFDCYHIPAQSLRLP